MKKSLWAGVACWLTSTGLPPVASAQNVGSSASTPPVPTGALAASNEPIGSPRAEPPGTPSSLPDPLSYADFTWAPASKGAADRPLNFGPITAEIRVDTSLHYSFARPSDNTICGSAEAFRHGEAQVTHLGVGGDLFYKNVIARVMTQFGMYSQTTPRNDSSSSRGAWQLDNAYRHLAEAYGGYHFDVAHGLNVEAGIFMSYIGLWSYYNADNWTYQPSYVSSNTPFFFNGLRAQFYPTAKLKIEPWLVNGWQAYGRFNDAPGVGLQVAWRPAGFISVVGNQYYGTDTLGTPDRRRVHTDESIMVKYLDSPSKFLSKAAASLTVDGGCESGGGVSCSSQYFLGFMAYNRLWFAGDRLAVTIGGGAIRNPGRYLVLLPPINGATAATGSPYFTLDPGDDFVAWDTQAAIDYMPSPFMTFRLEYTHRAANVAYFSGHGGVTHPKGQQGALGSAVEGWGPDLVKKENRLTGALLIKF